MMLITRKGRPQGSERARLLAFARGRSHFYMRDACAALSLSVPRANRLLQSCLGSEITQAGTEPVLGCKRPVAVYVAMADAGDVPARAVAIQPAWWVLAAAVVQ